MILKTISSFNLKTIIFMSISLGECQHLFVLILLVILSSKMRKWPLSWFHHLWFIKKCQYIWLKKHLLNHPPKYARTCGEPSKVLVTPLTQSYVRTIHWTGLCAVLQWCFFPSLEPAFDMHYMFSLVLVLNPVPSVQIIYKRRNQHSQSRLIVLDAQLKTNSMVLISFQKVWKHTMARHLGLDFQNQSYFIPDFCKPLAVRTEETFTIRWILTTQWESVWNLMLPVFGLRNKWVNHENTYLGSCKL